MPDDTLLPETDTGTTVLPPAKPMPSIPTLTDMVKNPNIPGDLMAATQKELGSIQGLSATIRAAQARAVKVMEDVLDNERENIKAHGDAGISKDYDANRMLQIVTPEQAQIYLDKRNAYRRYYDATANWTPETPYSQMAADIEKLNPLRAPVNSPAFATHVQMYTDAQKRALEIDKVREKQRKDQQEQSAAQMNQMMLPDQMRPQGVPKLSDQWLRDNAKNLSDKDIQAGAKYLAGGAEYSDARTRDDLLGKALYMDPDAFRAEVRNARGAHLLSNADEDHMLVVNAQAQTDAGVKFIKEAMDTKMLGNNPMMQAALNSQREKVIQLYLAEKAAHPEWNDSQRLRAAMELERDNNLFDAGSVTLSLAVTPGMRAAGITSKQQMLDIAQGPALLQRWKDYMTAETQAGRTTALQRTNEHANYLAWENYYNYAGKAQSTRQQKAKEMQGK